MKVRINFFAILRERAGAGLDAIDKAEGSTVEVLWRAWARAK